MGERRKAGRAANGQGSLLVTTKNGVEYYSIRYTDPVTGKQTAKGTSARTKTEARARFDAIKAAMTMGTFVPVNDMTVSQCLDGWLKHRKADIEPSTYSQYEIAVRLHIEPYFGKMRVRDLRHMHCQNFVDELRNKDMNPAYIRNIVTVLHAALDKAVMDGIISINPAQKLTLPKVKRKEPVTMDDETQEAFLRAVEGTPYQNVFLCALYTGSRPSEALGVRWKDIDKKTGEITISGQLARQTAQTQRGRKNDTKGHKTRSVFVPLFVIETVFKEERHRQNENRLKAIQAGGEWKNEDDFVFTREDGSPLPHRTIEHAFSRIAQKIGHPELTPHALRRTYISDLVADGVDPKTISDTVGHSAVSITLEVYAAARRKNKQAIAEKQQAEYEKRNAK